MEHADVRGSTRRAATDVGRGVGVGCGVPGQSAALGVDCYGSGPGLWGVDVFFRRRIVLPLATGFATRAWGWHFYACALGAVTPCLAEATARGGFLPLQYIARRAALR
jgi:hypothetical protein